MSVMETERLILRRLTLDDAPFILELLNEPSWLRFIGDKNVRTLADARHYIEDGPLAMYAREGFGLFLVEVKPIGVPAGICGLIRRDGMDDVDIGFAFLPRFWGKGYAHEAAAATMAHGRDSLGLGRIVAITSPNNHGSIRLLERLGLRRERAFRLPGGRDEIDLFA